MLVIYVLTSNTISPCTQKKKKKKKKKNTISPNKFVLKGQNVYTSWSLG